MATRTWRLVVTVVVAIALGMPVSAHAFQGRTTVWTADNSPYILKSDYVVGAEDTLVIEPGVTVRAQDGVRIVVEGVLQAEGSLLDGIVFTRADSAASWGGLRFGGKEPSMLAHVELTHAATAAAITGLPPTIRDVTLSRNGRGVTFSNPTSDVVIERAVFTHNKTALRGRSRHLIEIRSSDLWNNKMNIVAAPQRPYDCGSEGAWWVHHNDILRGPNDRYYSDDVRTTPGSRTSSYTVVADNNWWGSTDEADIEARMSNGESGIFDQERKPIQWAPAAEMPHTLWQPPGEVGNPAPEPISIADPGTISIIATPQHARCRDNRSVTAKGRGIGVIFPLKWVKVALVRRGPTGCKWWDGAKRRLVPGSCGEKVWTRARGTGDWSYRFGTLPEGKYRLWSLSNGEGNFEPARNDNTFRIR